MMDVLIPVASLVVLMIFGVTWGMSAKNRISTTAGWGVAAICLVFTTFFIYDWEQASKYSSKQFELTQKLPLEWNKAHQSYFFHHEGEWKSASAYIDHFDPGMVQENEEYDSCMVYKVSLPLIMKYFDTRWWSEDFEYRQSEDILLLSREKKTIEVK